MIPNQRSGLLRYKRGNPLNFRPPHQSEQDENLAQKFQAEEDEKFALKLARDQELEFKMKIESNGEIFDKKSNGFILDKNSSLNHEQLYEENKISLDEQIRLDEEIAKEMEQEELKNSKKSTRYQKNRYDPSFDKARSFIPPRHNYNSHNAVYSENPPQNPWQDISDPLENQSYEQLLELDKDMYNKGNGIHNYELEAIPISQYNASYNKDETSCSICLENFKNGESFIRLPCMHIFHKICGWEWLERKNSCPVCKTSAIERPS